MDIVFYLLDGWCPHGQSEGIFSYGDAQIDEVSPVEVKAYVENLGDVSECDHIFIPIVELAYIHICSTTRGAKKKVKGPKEIPSNLWGCTAQEDSIIGKECMIDRLYSRFKGESWEVSFFKELV